MNDFFAPDVTLTDIESFMIDTSHEIAVKWAHLAVSLATIKTHALYYQVAGSWQEYIKLERCGLKYRQSLKLAKAGEIYLRYQIECEAVGIKLSENRTKLSMVDPAIVEMIPSYFNDIKTMSSRQLKDYQEEKRRMIRAYPVKNGNNPVTVRGSSLYIGDQKIKGISLSEIKEAAGLGKRPLVIFIDDDNNAARRMRRRLEKITD